MKYLCFSLIVLCLFQVNGLCEELDLSQEHGEYLFKTLKLEYPHHFEILNKSGELVELKSDSKLGAYLISRLGQKYAGARIAWLNRPPRQGFKASMQRDPRLGIKELKLGEHYKDENSKPNVFWRTILFEMNNASQTEAFQKLKLTTDCNIDDYIKKGVRVEYRTALLTHAQYDRYWKDFCAKNNILFEEAYYFPPGKTFDQCYENMQKSEAGMQFLKAYEEQYIKKQAWLKNKK
ncbi:hypothetical protein [Persicirhabdus sediminis]|uniref:Uncharacterized protein n=1 Tax=Persicirhabdus sediminis TaxID=454144 RepID=A0A8J7SNU9_9BACT|nr:hypothetical protein [Persicirhabdus sediminis]MBK1791913.1 hypothetical protein [Persicirhabdus sediminis]